jgi:hypothetical protein
MKELQVVPFLLVLPTFTDNQKQNAEENMRAIGSESSSL